MIKHTNKIYITLLLFIFLLLITACTSTDNTKPIKNNDDVVIDENINDDNPSKYTAIENVQLLIERFNNQKNCNIITTGTVNTKALVFNYKQKINSQVIKENNRLYKESISYSTLKQVGQKLIIDDNKCYQINAKKISSLIKVEWNSNIDEYCFTDYLDLYGTNPFNFTGYIITKDTIISSDIKKESNNYKINILLDPIQSVTLYQKEMQVMSGSSSYPLFDSITINIIINNNWEIIETDIMETYNIKIPVLGSFLCTGELHQEYDYSCIGLIEEKDFRNKYIN